MNTETLKRKFMKRLKAVLFVMMLCGIGMTADAAEKILYTCTPLKPTELVYKVTVSDLRWDSLTYKMTIVTLNPTGEEVFQSGDAEYHDNMTYTGYYSEILDANLEMETPDMWGARNYFWLGHELIYMKCE